MENENLKCPFCRTENLEYGATVCKGCQSEIIYGATSDEVKAFAIFGVIVFSAVAYFVIFLVPQYANIEILKSGFGLGAYSFFLVVLIAIYGASKAKNIALNIHKDKIRFFRKTIGK